MGKKNTPRKSAFLKLNLKGSDFLENAKFFSGIAIDYFTL